MKRVILLSLLSTFTFIGCNKTSSTDKASQKSFSRDFLPQEDFAINVDVHHRFNPKIDTNSFQYKNLVNTKSFRKYILGSDISNYPELKFVGENPISVRDPYIHVQGTTNGYELINNVEIGCVLFYVNPNEDLKFGNLKAYEISYSFYKNKLINISIGATEELYKDLHIAYNARYNPNFPKDTVWHFMNDFTKIVFDTESFITYESIKTYSELEKDCKNAEEKFALDGIKRVLQ